MVVRCARSECALVLQEARKRLQREVRKQDKEQVRAAKKPKMSTAVSLPDPGQMKAEAGGSSKAGGKSGDGQAKAGGKPGGKEASTRHSLSFPSSCVRCPLAS